MFDHFTHTDDANHFANIAEYLEGAAMSIEENLESLGTEIDGGDVGANALMDKARKLMFDMYFLSGELQGK